MLDISNILSAIHTFFPQKQNKIDFLLKLIMYYYFNSNKIM